MKIYLKALYLFLFSIQIIHAQWEYEENANSYEKIFVKDFDNNTTFAIEKTKNGEVNFFIMQLELDECSIEKMEFSFDGYNGSLSFNVKEQGDDSLKILFDNVDGLDPLKTFAKLIRQKNILYAKFFDICSINKSIEYSLKGSSNAINKIGLIAFLGKTIKILEEKKNKIQFIVNSVPKLENRNFPIDRLGDVNPLDILEVSWKTLNQDRYKIKIRLKLNGYGYKELYGAFRLLRPADKIKSRY